MSFTKVDDFDLYALLYAGDENGENITPEQAAQAAEKANGRVQSGNETVTTDNTDKTSESSGSAAENIAKANSMSINPNMLVLGAVVLIGGGGVGSFLMKKKNNGKKNAAQSDLDYDEDNNEIVEEDDYPDYLDENNDE